MEDKINLECSFECPMCKIRTYEIKDKERYDGHRFTQIGWVCSDCYPTYKMIKDKINNDCNNNITRELNAIIEHLKKVE